jgi:hypothetical protein
MSDLRDKLRAATVGAPKIFGKEIIEYLGEKFEVRQPSVGQRAMIMQKAKLASGDVEKMDLAKMQIWATICCVYTEDGEAVFSDEDYDSLENQPCGGFVDEFSPVVLRLMNVEAEEKAKNSTPIRTDN